MATGGSAHGSDSSSDSESEETARLKESVNHEFIDKSLFDGSFRKETASKEDHAKKKLVSKRRQPEDDQYQNATHATPEFRKFIAKKLAKLIDSKVKEKTKRKKVKPQPEPEGGIKLLSTSNAFLDVVSIVPEPTTKRRKCSSSESSETERERMSQVAVTSDWVLNKEGIKGWEPKTRGDVILVTETGEVVEKKISRYSKE